MGTLTFVCPTTRRQVSSGVDIDASTFRRISDEVLFCSVCHERHRISDIKAWLTIDGDDCKSFQNDQQRAASR
jgi:hypothetical protein